VTLEVFGEGLSMGPLSDPMKRAMADRQGDIRYDIEWTTLGEYLEYLTARGVSPNVASLVGAGTVRMHELGEASRAPDPDELARMQELVRAAMREGALGVGSALIYTPGVYASTEELVALASAAAEHGGMYASHLRSEADRLVEAVDELIRISRESGAPAEIYHLKQAGEENWDKLTPTRRAAPASTRRCRPGSRRAGTRRGPGGWPIRRSERGSSGRCGPRATRGRTSSSRPARRSACSSWAFARIPSSATPERPSPRWRRRWD
jgi:hypothetical protein